MPNPYSVYMHDTDTPKSVRHRLPFRSTAVPAWTMSATSRPGCSRTVRRAGIAPRSTPAIAAGQTRIINLPHKIPVAWVYLTGWVTRNGTVEFRDDVYKHDESLDRAGLADVAAGGFVAPVARRRATSSRSPTSTAGRAFSGSRSGGVSRGTRP